MEEFTCLRPRTRGFPRHIDWVLDVVRRYTNIIAFVDELVVIAEQHCLLSTILIEFSVRRNDCVITGFTIDNIDRPVGSEAAVFVEAEEALSIGSRWLVI